MFLSFSWNCKWTWCFALNRLLKIFILHGWSGWKGLRVKDKWLKSLFPNLLFLLLVSGGKWDKGGSHIWLPKCPSTQGWGTTTQYPHRVLVCACYIGFAQVVWIVLRCCRFRWSKDDATLPISIDWQCHPQISINPGVCCHRLAGIFIWLLCSFFCYSTNWAVIFSMCVRVCVHCSTFFHMEGIFLQVNPRNWARCAKPCQIPHA